MLRNAHGARLLSFMYCMVMLAVRKNSGCARPFSAGGLSAPHVLFNCARSLSNLGKNAHN